MEELRRCYGNATHRIHSRATVPNSYSFLLGYELNDDLLSISIDKADYLNSPPPVGGGVPKGRGGRWERIP